MLKRILTLLMTLALVTLFSFVAVAEEGKKAPVTITKAMAAEALSAILPDVTVISVEAAKLDGLWEVAFKSGGKMGVIYLDSDREFLIIGSLVGLKSGVNYSKLKFEEINTVDFASISLADALIMGDAKAKHKVIVFDDPD
jgi:protein-disulfide isomerase